MLIRGIRQLVAFIGSLAFITSFLAVSKLYKGKAVAIPYGFSERWAEHDFFNSGRKPTPDFISSDTSKQESLTGHEDHDKDEFDLNVYGKPVHEVFSLSTRNRKYFDVSMGDYEAYNPNIIPHPDLDDTYIVVAQKGRDWTVPNTVWFAQLVCNAKFQNGRLECIKSPLLLPIPATLGDRDTCTGNLAFLAFNIGPHDARVFYGPNNPYIVYGSQSNFGCFGQYAQDLRLLIDWGVVPISRNDADSPFRKATELQRPIPFGAMEKNWFLFWDNFGQLYAHYDVYPKRSLAQLNPDGTSGLDLAAATAKEDEKCMARYMPQLAPTLESIHQATNSLSVTMCKRSDSGCTPNDSNTFLMTIFQHKTYYNYHSVYEPYVMLFKQSSPFAIHGISTKPIWIHGRGKAPRPEGMNPDDPWDATEMFYITSMAWKLPSNKYHGYIDDILFLSVGIEDSRSGGIDVLASDILDHLGLCSDSQSIVNPDSPHMSPPNVPDLSGLQQPDAILPPSGNPMDNPNLIQNPPIIPNPDLTLLNTDGGGNIGGFGGAVGMGFGGV